MALFRRLAGRHACVVWLAVGWLCALAPAQAQTTWSATPSNGNLNVAGNWASGTLPATTSSWVFDASNTYTLNNDFASLRANGGITFSANAGSYTISGNSITLGGNVTNSGSLAQTINTDLVSNVTRTIGLSGTGGTVVLAGNISGSGGLNATGPASGLSYLTLSGSNSFLGNVTANVRVGLNINNQYALGSGTQVTVRNTAVIDNTSGADIQLAQTTNIMVGGGDGGFTFNTTSSLDFGDTTFSFTNNMGLTVTGSRTITLGSLTPSGASASTLSFNKAGTGVLALRNAASASMAGAVTLSSGMVQLGHDRSLGDGTITFNGSTIQALNGARILGNAVSIGGVTATPSTVSGTNSVTFSGQMTGATGNPRVLSNNLGPNSLLTIANLGLNADTANTRSLTISGSGNTLITGAISDGNASKGQNLIIASTGITTISGTSSYGGTTQVNAGTLVFRSTAAKAAGTVTAAAAGSIGLGVGGTGYYGSSDVAALFGNTLTGFSMNAASGVAVDTNAGDFTITNALAGSRAFSKLGANTLTLTATNTYSGTTWIAAGTLQLGNNTTTGQLNASSVISGEAGARLAFNRTNSVTQGNDFANGIGGAISVAQVGSGTLTLSSSNSYSGGTTLSAGTLEFAVNALGSGTITLNGGTLRWASGNVQDVSGKLALVSGSTAALDTNGNDVTLANGFGAGTSASLTKTGAGRLVLNGSTGYTGATTVSSGTLQAAANALANTTSIAVNGASLSAVDYNASASLAIDSTGFATISGTGLSLGAVTNANATAAALDFTSTSGTITLTSLSGAGSTRFRAGASIGGTVSQGAVAIDGVGTLGTVSGGTVSLNGATASITTLNGGRINLANNVVLSVQTGTFGGAITGAGSLTKNGSGVLTLTGSNSHSGGTTVSGGTLSVNGYLGGSSALMVQSGATVGGSGLIAGGITGDGQIGPGNSPGILTTPNIAPTGSTSFAFEFTQLGSPTWSTGTASGNDVLRLTDPAAPFASSLVSSNVVNVYFGVGSLAMNDTFLGGFFTDKSGDFSAFIKDATFRFYVLGNGSGTATIYNGLGYYDLNTWAAANVPGFTNVGVSTVAAGTTDFASGTITTGQVVQFVIVPEPGTAIIAGIGIAMGGWTLAKRRRQPRRAGR